MGKNKGFLIYAIVHNISTLLYYKMLKLLYNKPYFNFCINRYYGY